jgi:uncharacterized alpha-E superfamily protein
MDDMTRDESWRFLILGRRLERLAHLAGVVERVLRFGHDERIGSLEWLLEAANCIVTYRSRYRRAPELLPVAHLVLFDRTNPHSIAFQTAELRADLDRAVAELGTFVPRESISALDDAVIEAARDLVELEHPPGDQLESACAELASLAERCKLGAFAISDELGRHFFSHAGTFPTIGGAQDEELGD